MQLVCFFTHECTQHFLLAGAVHTGSRCSNDVQEQDEIDELVLADDDMFDMAPEDLPRRVLSDFAVYNSEGFCASLELLPMWSGVDPDVDLYASGNVLADDGEWAHGQSLSAGI